MIRRLTEQESFRLQGYNEEEIKTLAENFSMSRCYRLAGNSITVDVLESIFESIFEELGENTFNQH